MKKQAVLFFLKNKLSFANPDTYLIPADKLKIDSLFSKFIKIEISEIIEDVLKEVLFFGEEELAKMIVTNYMNELDELNEYLENASEDFNYMVRDLLQMGKNALLEKISV